MVIKFFNLAIALVLSALFACLLYMCSDFADGKLALAITSFVVFALTTAGAWGVSFENVRSGVNIKVLATVFLVLAAILNLVYAFLTTFSIPLYIILNGILVCIYLLAARWIYSTGM